MVDSQPLWKSCADWLCRLEVLPDNHRVLRSDASIHDLGMISHKKSLITIFGHKHKIKNFITKFDIFHEKISWPLDFGLYLESNCEF